MPHYHFHVCDGQDYVDTPGTDLPDLSAARVEAVRYSGELLKDSASRFWADQEWSMRVTDDAELTLFTLTFFASSAASTW